MRGLLVDPILNSPHKYHKNIMTDSKRITTWILGVKGLKQKYHREPMKTQRKHRKLCENQKNGSKHASHNNYCLISVNLKVSWKKITEKCNEVSHYLLLISPCHPPGVTKNGISPNNTKKPFSSGKVMSRKRNINQVRIFSI